MSDVAVRVHNLGKQYRIGERAHYKTVRDSFSSMVLRPIARMRGKPYRPLFGRSVAANSFWALRHISFELRQGELLGIIGRNGAGKSTLLKILSQITEPTEGVADVRGRVRSLLEVGTGFHPELTGRENIYLNGAILGMKRAEITRKFEEIVAFAEVERFLDTPVKWYSSGMYTRLAFSVAAHLEPQVLIVDEVLAVGDASFQQRCLAKMQEVSQTGRTVFFVSHIAAAITRLCPRVILLDGGQIMADGPADKVVGDYMDSVTGSAASRNWLEPGTAPGSDAVRLRSVRVRLEDGSVSTTADIARPVGIEMQYDVLIPGLLLAPSFQFFSRQKTCLFASTSPRLASRPAAAGRYTSTCWIPGNLLAEGSITATAVITQMDSSLVHVFESDAVAFDVKHTIHSASAHSSDGSAPYPGLIRPLLDWTTDVASLSADSILHA